MYSGVPVFFETIMQFMINVKDNQPNLTIKLQV